MRRLARVAVGFVVVFTAAQFIRPGRTNPPTDAIRTIRAHETTKGLGTVLDRSCGDCHSNATVWSSWYTQIAPLSWFMAHEVAEGRRVIEESLGPLLPEPEFRTNGPATYYQISGRNQRLGFIGAMTNLHFCENCNKLRLTCDGKLRPCLGSYLEFDIMSPLRAGASDEDLRQFFLDVVERKPEQHDFRTTYQPGRKMVAIGG